MVEPFDGTQDPHAHLQAFQTQMYISGGDDKLSCKLFPGTLRGVAMQWMATLPARTIRTSNDLASAFASQFAANKAKRLEVADLFDIRQAKGESLKSYLARFNNATVRVRAEKHVEAEEDQTEWLEEERSQNRKNNNRIIEQRTTHRLDAPRQSEMTQKDNKHFTLLNEKRAQILREICHTRLLHFPLPLMERSWGITGLIGVISTVPWAIQQRHVGP
ncbi:hypothetical protein CR513_31541, partial [Mucuna pruriens]